MPKYYPHEQKVAGTIINPQFHGRFYFTYLVAVTGASKALNFCRFHVEKTLQEMTGSAGVDKHESLLW